MKLKKILITAVLIAFTVLQASAQYIKVQKDDKGWRLLDGRTPVEVKGIVWSYTPIGETHTYDLWSHSDAFIMKMIDTDMPKLKAMGVNTIRCFSNIPPQWVEYIYMKYGIYTIINDLLGRYGISVNGTWYATTDYSDLYTRQTLIEQARNTADTYRGVKGVLMYMFGNESNYGLVWSGSNIEDLPAGEQDTVKAGYLYSLLEEAMAVCKDTDPLRPVGFINGDTQYLELIAKLCPSLDILGVNAYRGFKFYDSFYENIETILDKPVIFTEAGADAYNAILQQEDQYAQMAYLRSQWEELYSQSYGKGKSGNMLGGCVFEWMDEWWKHYQNKDLTVHNTVGTWANSGYELDYENGINNMDEEWFGITAQSPIMKDGINVRVPRAAYYLMQDIWQLSIYNSSAQEVQAKFATLNTNEYLVRGNEKSIKQSVKENKMVAVSYVDATVRATTGFDGEDFKTLQKTGNWKDVFDPHISAEATVGVTAQPLEGLTASVQARAFSDAPYTRLNETYACYYTDNINDKDGAGDNTHLRYADVYQAAIEYDNPLFTINGYYHKGHGNYEESGDIFNITKEAYDLITADMYGSKAPIALEFTGKDFLQGFSVIGGPEIWEDAKPQIIFNYFKRFPTAGSMVPDFAVGAVYAEELGQSQNVNIAPYNSYGSGRKISLYGEMVLDPWLTVKLGVLHAGSEKWGASYVTADSKVKKIDWVDTLGAYGQIGTSMFQHSYIYLNAIYRGLVAETNGGVVRGGFFTSDSGAGNRFEMQAGADLAYGFFSLKPVFRARAPLQGPNGRSLISGSPFIVGLGNRQAIEFEAVLTFDPEGATWFHEWNSNDVEGAPIAASLSGMYTLYAGKTDVIPYKSDTWDTSYDSDGAYLWYDGIALPVQKNLWQVAARVVANPLPGLRLTGTAEGGTLGSTGDSDTLITFAKFSLGARYNHWMLKGSYAYNAWGDENWWRIFNYTFPAQWTVDLSYGFGTPIFAEDTNRVGLKCKGRTFGKNSSDGYGIWADGTDVVGRMYMEITMYMNIRY